MTTFTTLDSTTIREDLVDYVTIISPNDVPLHHALAKEPAHSREFDWGMDNIDSEILGDRALGNDLIAVLEGYEAQFPVLTPRERARNYTQQWARTARVSDTERKVLEAGVHDEFSYQVYKKFLETLKQADYSLHFSSFAQQSGSEAYQTHGVIQWLWACGLTTQTSATIAGQTIDTSIYRSTLYDGSQADLTRDTLNGNLLLPAHVGGMDLSGAIAFCSSQMKQLISTFTAVYNSGSTVDTVLPLNERRIDASERRLIDAIDVFESDFGTLYMNVDRRMNDGTTAVNMGSTIPESGFFDGGLANRMIMILDPTMFCIRVLEPLSFVPLAKSGLNTKGLIQYHAGMMVKNPKGGIFGFDVHG